MLNNSESGYGSLAQLFHLLMLLVFVVLFFSAWVMTALDEGSLRSLLYRLHKSLGVTALLLVLLRLAWRFLQVQPRPLSLEAQQRNMARLAHLSLYLLMFAMPVSGYLMSVAGGYGIEYFGFFSIPELVAEDKNMSDTAAAFHGLLAWLLLMLVAVHAMAAFWHHRVAGDDTLRRMLPGYRG